MSTGSVHRSVLPWPNKARRASIAWGAKKKVNPTGGRETTRVGGNGGGVVKLGRFIYFKTKKEMSWKTTRSGRVKVY